MDAPLLFVSHPETGELVRRRWRVVVVGGDEVGRQSIIDTTPALIGAAPAAQLVLSDDTVSRYHLEVEVAAEGARLRDLDSTNGTYVHDARIREDFIGPHQIFRVGQTDVQLVPIDEPVSSEIDTDPREAAPDAVVELLGVVAKDARMREILRLLRRVAPSSSSVLFEGEPGTGRARLARLLHELSPRRDAPFLALNLRSLAEPADLAERLFGRSMRQGQPSRPGFLEAARGGTLFLESVEHLPAELEAPLLHALKRGEAQRFGEEKKHRIDVRFAASVGGGVRAGKVPAALAPHLSAVRVRVPPLRARAEDLLPLAERFLSEAGAKAKAGPATRGLFETMPWPQNADQLRQMLERALDVEPRSTPDSLGVADRTREALIADTVRHHRGQVSRAAADLALGTRTLFRYLAERDIDLDAML